MQAVLKSNDKGFWFTVRSDSSLSGYGFYKHSNGFNLVNFITIEEAETQLLSTYPSAVIVTPNEYATETMRRNAVYNNALIDARASNNGRLPSGWVAPFNISG